ncbi:hypothetical protein M407DRAFT_245120 [Tulasnella calospora MUT 4182]|uniref:Uncharacterized protein n=1 Tax=Tulasnella calospora MUT 4182 TaxID=1051891 RepID=A0A0C3QBK5_9AGAM|nr:hypothetical protein M407DRAFT_245120 [Tulasnella calospora MUT 4182]
MLCSHPGTKGEGGGTIVNIYVWKDSELDGMNPTVEEVKGILGVERVMIGVNPESKKRGWNL